ncbi:MAG: alpha/beta hydrolase [Chitinophagaceae bacterium]|nr:alpha/beta hydrolase [Chitinophagaceae bacterium]MCW5928100.1 alpha/beta hydrolase [Chitinophagaceae bacterium]
MKKNFRRTGFKILPLFLVIVLSTLSLSAQKKIVEQPLYPRNDVPGNIDSTNEEKSETKDGILRVSHVSIPNLAIFLPPSQKATGAAVVICPGGGYSIIAIGHEGYDVARKLNEMGVAAFVLKYRIPDSQKQNSPFIAPLQDVQQAIYTVRKNAAKWGIKPDRVGIMGFSAGGHLASTAATKFEPSLINNGKISIRPDFQILVYPVISTNFFIKHAGSFNNLLGEKATASRLNEYSSELNVTAKTPPAFLVHASDDAGVKVDNSVVYYQALLKNKVPAEMHLYQNGGHGFGLKNKTTTDEWILRCKAWLDKNGWLKK